jgi:hypothetical protein
MITVFRTVVMKVKKRNGLRRLFALLRKALLVRCLRRQAEVTQNQAWMTTDQKVMFHSINKVFLFNVLGGVRKSWMPGCHDD